MIAAAIAADPELLIADEPTTALDVTVQHGILRLLISLSEQRQMSVLFVSHDLGVIRFVCDRVAVVYGGQVVEIGRIDDVVQRTRGTGTPTRCSPRTRGCRRTTTSRSFIGQRLADHRRARSPRSAASPADAVSGIGARMRRRPARPTPPPVTTGDGHRYSCWNPAGKD